MWALYSNQTDTEGCFPYDFADDESHVVASSVGRIWFTMVIFIIDFALGASVFELSAPLRHPDCWRLIFSGILVGFLCMSAEIVAVFYSGSCVPLVRHYPLWLSTLLNCGWAISFSQIFYATFLSVKTFSVNMKAQKRRYDKSDDEEPVEEQHAEELDV